MKRSLIIIILCLFINNLVFSQSEGPDEPKLPQIFPVSPEAASLGKYGDVPVNLSTGKINYTVPLYTIKVKDFEWPIYLSYNYSGLLLEEDPSVVGLGWDLMATGRITREIRGIPDELDTSDFKKTQVVPYLKGNFDNLTTQQYKDKQFLIYEGIANSNKDGQFDKYVVSAGNVSGSFVFDENDNPVFLTHRNYVADKDSIIDDKGVKYYFNETEIAEYNIQIGFDVAPRYVPSSYLLTKIKLPDNGGEILFDYEPYDPNDVHYKTVWTDTEITGLETKTIHSPSQVKVDYRRLKEISFPNGKIIFKITPHNQTYNFQNISHNKRNYTLEEVKVVNSNQDSILRYDFVYNDEIRSKKLLKEIVKSNNGNVIPFFEFDYNNENQVGDFFNYTQQDFWGYYNGQGANNLLLATREIDTVKTKYGALENIKYPTGGSTAIAYQQNTIFSDETNTAVQCSYSHNKTVTKRLNAVSPGVVLNWDRTVDVGHSQIVKVTITAAVKKGTSTNALGSFADIQVSANNADTTCGFSTISNISLYADAENCGSYQNPNDCHGDLILSQEIIGYAGDGILHITGSVMEFANKEAYIEYSIEYEEATINNSKKVGGIRVTNTTDCDGFGDCYTNNYKYVLEDGTTPSGIILGGTPQFEYSTYHDQGSQSGYKNYRSAKSKAPLGSYQGAPVFYERVEIIKNSGQRGKTINYYTKGNQNTNPSFPFLPAVNYDWQKGKIKRIQYFSLENETLNKIKSETNNYDVLYPYGGGSTSTKKVFGMAVSRSRWIENGPDDPNDYIEDYNYEIDKEYNLVESIIKEFYDTDSITTITSYTYDLPYNQIIDKTVTSSEGGSLKQKIFYPYSDSNLSSQNKISIPIKQQTFNVIPGETEQLLSTQNTVYDNISGLYLPINLQTSKGIGTLQDRITYHSYNSAGNIKEISIKDGTIITYLWGYNNQYPVAKIENASYLEVIATGVNLTTINDPSTSESNMRTELNKIRNHSSMSNAMVTTNTYNILIGVTSTTDPRGYITYYVYDDLNRLIQVKNANGEIISENEYHYKNQE